MYVFGQTENFSACNGHLDHTFSVDEALHDDFEPYKWSYSTLL